MIVGSTKLFLNALLTVVMATLPMFGAGQSSNQQLNPRIGSPVPARYAAVRDAKDWLNPYLQICAAGADLTVHSIKLRSFVAIRDVRDALVKLPVEAWSYGRVVALQECSIGVPGDAQASRQRLAEVEAVLKALGLQISHWPA
jgi:hypothetical protein